jgi:hypothetical protein
MDEQPLSPARRTAVFCFIENSLKPHLKRAGGRMGGKSNNARLDFTDKRAYLLTKSFVTGAFPHLSRYAPFLARLHRLLAVEGLLIRPGRVHLLCQEGAYRARTSA